MIPEVFAQRCEVIKSMEGFVASTLPILIPPQAEYWSPSQILPDTGGEEGIERLRQFRKQEEGLTEPVLVSMIANTCTEENLPAYLARLSMFEPFRDFTGTDPTPWPSGSREWASQEYFHGWGSMKYLDLTGRVNMVAVERTNRNLIRNGFNMDVEDPYEFFIYTDNQEGSTRDAHGKTAALAKKDGALILALFLSHVTGDEARHQRYYRAINQEIARLDPEGFVQAFYNMMRKGVVMPTKLIDHRLKRVTPKIPRLFMAYGEVASRLGIYTKKLYAKQFGHLIEACAIKDMHLSGEAQEAKERLLALYDQVVNQGEEEAIRISEIDLHKPFDLSAFKPWLE